MYDVFLQRLKEYNLESKTILDIIGGKCVLNDELTFALVYLDGRYPMEKKFSYNTRCTESIEVLNGECTLYYNDQVIDMKKGDKFEINPGNKYAFSGNCICIDRISPSWDKTQNSYID